MDFVRWYGWAVKIVLGYCQVDGQKPDPEVLRLAMKRAHEEPATTLHVGDQPEDTQAPRAARVTGHRRGLGNFPTQHSWSPQSPIISYLCYGTVATPSRPTALKTARIRQGPS